MIEVNAKEKPKTEKLPKMTIYKTATCGCCGKWIDHIKEAGFETEVIVKDNLKSTKEEFKIPRELGSCHTGIIDGYVIEGHVPASDVKKLLKSKKKVIGISVPKMPVGSPGMEIGNRKDPYDVISFSKDGKKEVFTSYRDH
jgi:hypothetical protein